MERQAGEVMNPRVDDRMGQRSRGDCGMGDHGPLIGIACSVASQEAEYGVGWIDSWNGRELRGGQQRAG